jgi:ATP-dependent helicase/nuclease subunit A
MSGIDPAPGRGGPAPIEPVDRAERDRARGVDASSRRGRLLVEAAAGSGKTAVLVDRVLSYVLAGERRIAEMVVVTFTEAAAAELRLRLRQGVVQRLVESAAGGDSPNEPGQEALEVARLARLRQALVDLESAKVGTIHAMCFEMLRQAPIDAGVDPFFRVSDELESTLRFFEAWEEFLRAVDDADEGLEIAADLDMLQERDLRAAAASLVGVDVGRLPRPVDGAPERARLLAELEERLAEGVRSASPGGALRRALEAQQARLAALSRFDVEGRVGRLLRQRKVAANLGKSDEVAAKAARDAVNERFDRLAHDRLARFARWLAKVQSVTVRREEAGAVLTFDQLIVKARDLMRDRPAVREDFRRRHPIVLIDEFQDTDRAQVELLSLLAGDAEEDAAGPRSFVVVGDPKQSIYRFRGADLETYRRLREDWGDERRVVLRQTFRSVPALVEWINPVMERVFGPAFEPYEAPFHPQEALTPTVEPEPSGVFQLLIEVPPETSVFEARSREADAFAALALRLVRGDESSPPARVRHAGGLRAAGFGDIALLLPKLTDSARYEEAFARRGVPLRVLGGRHYYRRDEIHALVRLLAAVADPGDTVAALATLRGPAFGVSDRALLAMHLTEPRIALDRVAPLDPSSIERRAATSPDPAAARDALDGLARLVELRALAGRLAPPELVSALLERTCLVPFFAVRDRGEQRVQNLFRIVALARRIERSGRGSLLALVKWLEQLTEEEPREGEIGEPEEGSEMVSVRTIHGAKGLEFPIVFLGGLPGSDGMRDDGLQHLESASGGVELAAARLRTDGWEAAKEREKERDEAETKRKLYVALTRARDLLVVPEMPGYSRRVGLFRALAAGGPWSEGNRFAVWTAAPPAEGAAGSVPLLDLDAPALSGAVALRREAVAAPSVGRTLLRPSGLAETHGPFPVASPASLAPAPTTPTTPSAPSEASARARDRALLLGGATHRRLARAFGVAVEELAADGEVAAAADRLSRAFLDSPLGARALAAPHRLVEHVFAAAAPRLVMEGAIDLAFDEGAGWILVDYKTDRIERGKTRETAERHREQVLAYALLLERVTRRAVIEAHVFFVHGAVDVAWSGPGLEAGLREVEERWFANASRRG